MVALVDLPTVFYLTRFRPLSCHGELPERDVRLDARHRAWPTLAVPAQLKNDKPHRLLSQMQLYAAPSYRCWLKNDEHGAASSGT